MVLWGIWFVKNQKVWESKSITPTERMDISFKQLKDWQEAMKKNALIMSSPTNTNVAGIYD